MMTGSRERIALSASNLICHRGSGPRRFELHIDGIELRSGEVLVILGPNGAGKSTLLRALAGLEGRAANQSIQKGTGPATLVFQRPAALSGSVAGNVRAALLGKGIPEPMRRERVARALARFDISPLENQNAKTLSGGELRRLALARAFVLDPSVLLLDEPFDDLDGEGQRRLSIDLQRAIQETSVAVAMVTHDLRRALLLADRIAVLIDGRLAQFGRRDEVLEKPFSPEIARTVGMTNIATGTVRRIVDGVRWIEVAEGFEIPATAEVSIGESTWIGIRPENLKLDIGRGVGQPIGKAVIESLVSDGLATVVSVRAQNLTFTTHLLSGRGLSRRLRPGDRVSLAVQPEHVHALSSGTSRSGSSRTP